MYAPRVLKRTPGKIPVNTFEAMEPRRMLSASTTASEDTLNVQAPVLVRLPRSGSGTSGSNVESDGSSSASSAGGYSAAQMRGAYGVGPYGSSNITFNGIQGDGTGQTIALIDMYNDPDIATDLATFDAAEGLPAPPSFKVLNQTGGTSLPSNDVQNPNSGSDWAPEECLDVEWSHVMAPGASIIVFECSSNLEIADQTAADYPGVSVVSNSWGSSESSSEASAQDPYFTTPSGHAGVTFFASTGDTAGEISYPAESPNVVAVGGTALNLNGSTWSSETVWNDSSGGTGGGSSKYEAQPAYQKYVVTSTKRRDPDVSLDADPATGVPICDSWDYGSSTPWAGVYGGTSLASPMMAGLVAVADQGRVAEGLGELNSNQTLTRMYEMYQYSTTAIPNPTANFHDITVGSNGHAATVGWDEASGIGTPIANYFVPDLAGSASITGRIFVDTTGTGIYQAGDTVMAGQTVYLDLNNDGSLDNGEPTAVTNSQGIYTFTDEPAGGTVRMSTPAVAGYVAVPASASISYGATNTINFTYFPLSFSNTTTNASYIIQTDATNTKDQILVNGAITDSVAKSVLAGQSLSFSLTGSGDSFTVNAANGNPLPSGGITLTGPSGGLPLNIIGTATGADTYNVSSASVAFDSDVITASKFSSITLNPGTGTNSLTVNSGSPTIAAQTPGAGILTRNFSNISIASGSSVLFATASSHGDHTLVETSTLSVLGQLDLGGNDLIVHNGNLAAINTLLATGYNSGQWNGQGIDSAAAHADTTYLTALGAIQNTLYGGTGQPKFDGMSPLGTDVLVKFTYYGDANLDGQIDGTDYSRIDNAYGSHATGWFNGDFNYDGSVDGSDYTLIDNDFNMQGASLAAQTASPGAMIGSASITNHQSTATGIFQTTSQITLNNPSESGVEKLLLKKDVVDQLSSL